MEGLRRLQAVHATLQLMRQHALCGSDGNGPELANSLSDYRFLADFFLFMSQSCADAKELKRKCDVLMNRLPAVSMNFLRALVAENCTEGSEAFRIDPDASKVPTSGCRSIPVVTSSCGTKTRSSNDGKSSTIDFPKVFIHACQRQADRALPEHQTNELFRPTQSEPSVGIRAMERASTTLEDFCRSYFMFHDLDAGNPQHLFKHLPLLSFVEAFIYQLDDENEKLLYPDQRKTGLRREGRISNSSFRKDLGSEPFRGLQVALANRGLLTERIQSEMKDGVEYWQLEKSLCEAVRNGAAIAMEDVLKAMRMKSFDYRVLNLLLYSSTGKEVNEAHFSFLGASEFLVEISDDLFDYEDDVLSNSFNILRMLVKVYGPNMAPEILTKLIIEEETKYWRLAEGLEPGLVNRYQERCKEATKEGGGSSKHQWGTWTIPAMIANEMTFRSQVHGTSACPNDEVS